MNKFRSTIEVALTRLGLVVIPRLPRRAILVLARVLGRTAYFAAVHLRRVGQTNLNLAFKDALTPRQKTAILKKSFETFALILLDSFWFMRDIEKRLARHVRFDDSLKPFLQKKAQMCLTAHMGNWEVLGQAAAARGYPLTGVADPLANPAVDELFKDIRFRLGLRTVPRKGAVRELLRTLRNGDKLGLLLDQNTKPSEGGIFVNFFGLPVPVSAVGASLALRADAEIVFGFCLPQPDGNYLAYGTDRLQPALKPGETALKATHRLTQEITDVIEREVRLHPETWLWTYKRWKYVGPGRRREEYPFYSKRLPDDELRAAGGGETD